MKVFSHCQVLETQGSRVVIQSCALLGTDLQHLFVLVLHSVTSFSLIIDRKCDAQKFAGR